jgi:hypothetical protein
MRERGVTVRDMSVPAPALIAQGPHLARMPALPAARDFVTSAGFGGAAALLAALVVAGAAALAARRVAHRHTAELEQKERHHQDIRRDEQHAAAVARCWQRLVWLVETAGIEPAASEGATLGLGPELALELLRGLLRDTEQLGDDTLAGAVSVYLGQFTLVLAQQGSLLGELAAAPSPGDTPAQEHTPTQQPEAPPPPAVQEPAAGRRVAGAGRRRRR